MTSKTERSAAFCRGYNTAIDQFYPQGPHLVAEEITPEEDLLDALDVATARARELGLDRLAHDLEMRRNVADITLRSFKG